MFTLSCEVQIHLAICPHIGAYSGGIEMSLNWNAPNHAPEGHFPKPLKFGPRTTVWRVEDKPHGAATSVSAATDSSVPTASIQLLKALHDARTAGLVKLRCSVW